VGATIPNGPYRHGDRLELAGRRLDFGLLVHRVRRGDLAGVAFLLLGPGVAGLGRELEHDTRRVARLEFTVESLGHGDDALAGRYLVHLTGILDTAGRHGCDAEDITLGFDLGDRVDVIDPAVEPRPVHAFRAHRGGEVEGRFNRVLRDRGGRERSG